VNLDEFDTVYMHMDCTHTGKESSDYFACWVIWESKRDKNFYLLDFVLRKCDPEIQARVMIGMYQKFASKVRKATFDEKSNNGFWYWCRKLAKEEYGLSLPLQELKFASDKFTHLEPTLPHFKANRVYLPSNNPMIQIASDQLLAFPTKGVHDDMVDLMSWLLSNYTKTHKEFEFIL
jgi:predicted phage terminase large subunit-like protein